MESGANCDLRGNRLRGTGAINSQRLHFPERVRDYSANKPHLSPDELLACDTLRLDTIFKGQERTDGLGNQCNKTLAKQNRNVEQLPRDKNNLIEEQWLRLIENNSPKKPPIDIDLSS